MFYHIMGLCPAMEDGGIRMGGCGFSIALWPAWKRAVAQSKITQEMVDKVIQNLGRDWLDGCGYDKMYDPSNCGIDHNPRKPLGPEARKLYMPYSIRVTWGEWGPEHITVPGDACGLDLTAIGVRRPPDGAALAPHNVDNIRQAHLLLVIFTWFADDLVFAQGISPPDLKRTKK